MKLARELGYELGEKSANLGLSLSDSLEAFLWHRSPGTKVITWLIRRRGMLGQGVVNLILLVNYLLDEILLSIIKAYQDYQTISKNE